MTQVSVQGLPPKTASLAEKLNAAMARKGIRSNRELARRIGASNSLVGKWRRGKTHQIRSPQHLEALSEVLGTQPDYFVSRSATDRLAELEATAVRTADLAPVWQTLLALANGDTAEARRVLSEAAEDRP